MRVNSMIVVKGPQKGCRFDLPVGIVTVGREQTNSVQIPDPEVSRRHAELHFQDDGFVVVDLGSANGVFVNNERVKNKLLSAGDEVKMGGTTFLILDEEVSRSGHCSDSEMTNLKHGPARFIDSGPAETVLGVPVSPETVDWIAQAKSNLQMMCETAVATSLHTEMDRLIERLMDLVFSWIAADRACVILKDDSLGEWTVRSTRQRAKRGAVKGEFSLYQPILEYVLEKDEGIFSVNQKNDPRLVHATGGVEVEERAVMCAPIRGRDEIRGVIYVDCVMGQGESGTDSSPALFNPEQLKMLLAIGHQAAVAIENTGYYSMMLQRERNIAVGEVMESLSHYIKNVMQSINGGTHLIECGLKEKDHELVEQGWKMVQRNQEYLSGLVMDMLAHSKPQVPNQSPGDLYRLLESTMRCLERRAEHRNVELRWELVGTPPATRFDHALLERAFQNLVLTAVNTCREGGVVSLTMAGDEESNQVVVRIQNSGSDMLPEEFESIFDPLSVNENSNLMGIAMAVSANSLKAHRGTVKATRESGSGIVFDIMLPRVAED